MKSKLKLSLIANKSKRNSMFKRRKKGMMKKLNQLVTLCDVKACAVFYSPEELVTETWPQSDEVFQEVVTKFRDIPTKKMVNHETFLLDRINKAKEHSRKLCKQNRDSQLREFMFNILRGEMIDSRYDAKDIQDLDVFVHNYITKLNQRVKFLTENGESSSSSVPPPPPPSPLAGESFPIPPCAGAAGVTAPNGFYDHINMSLNQSELLQYRTSDVVAVATPHAGVDATAMNNTFGFYDHTQYQNMNMSLNQYEPAQNQYEPVQYQTSDVVAVGTPHAGVDATPMGNTFGFYNYIQNQNMNMSPNQYEPAHNQYEPVQYQPSDVVAVGTPHVGVDATTRSTPTGIYDHIIMIPNQPEPVQYQSFGVVADETPLALRNALALTTPNGFYDYVQYQNTNMSLNKQELVQYQTPGIAEYATPHAGFYDLIQYQNMNMSQNQHEPVQYQIPQDSYDQIQQGIYGMNSDHNVSQYPNQQQSFVEMGSFEQHASSHNYYHNQVPIPDFTTTGLMSTVNTTATVDVYAPNINNDF